MFRIWHVDDDTCVMDGEGNSILLCTNCDARGEAESPEAAMLIALAPDMLAEIIKQRDWLRHIRPQITADESVFMGFDQSEKYLSMLIKMAGRS